MKMPVGFSQLYFQMIPIHKPDKNTKMILKMIPFIDKRRLILSHR